MDEGAGGRGTTVGESAVYEDGFVRVPHYRQSLDFTCGPACLMMAMAYFDPALSLSRLLEVDIWRESNLVEAYACSRQGLAYAAYRRGFAVRTRGNAETIELVERLGLSLTEESRQTAIELHQDVLSRCAASGIPDERGPVSLEHIEGWLDKGWLPLLLTDSRLVSDETLPHWVLVVGVGRGGVHFHDPLSAEGPSVRDEDFFARMLSFDGISCAVVVKGLKSEVGNRQGE